ncbi:MAG TPA: polysaccharide deacetylase family protein [Acidimicrobiia bacterium]
MHAPGGPHICRGRAVVSSLFVLTGVLAGCGSSRPASAPPTSRSGSSTASTTAATTTTTPTTTPTQPPATTAATTTTRPSGPAVVVRHGAVNHRRIALTFDAGSDAGNTAAILDLLAARHVRATFSLTGAWTRANPQLAQRIAREGHTIVNHTDTHRSFTGFSTGTPPLTSAERTAQLSRGDAAIVAATGRSSKPWFRPPFGDIDASTPVDVARSGYRYVLLWTVDSLGWKGLPPATVIARCLDGATPGAILLLHVGSASTDFAALPGILDGLGARGFSLVTVATPGFVTG